jgi:hypothetical protein
MLSGGSNFGFVVLPDGRAMTLQIHASSEEAEDWMIARADEEKQAKYDTWREKIEGWKAEIRALDEAAKKDMVNLSGQRLHNPDGAPPLYGLRSKEDFGGVLRKASAFEWYERHYSQLARAGILYQLDAAVLDKGWFESFRANGYKESGRTLQE